MAAVELLLIQPALEDNRVCLLHDLHGTIGKVTSIAQFSSAQTGLLPETVMIPFTFRCFTDLNIAREICCFIHLSNLGRSREILE
jgi:hypothetical protein